eukprot:5471201-Pleurochrysis_carterae.AAC.2
MPPLRQTQSRNDNNSSPPLPLLTRRRSSMKATLTRFVNMLVDGMSRNAPHFVITGPFTKFSPRTLRQPARTAGSSTRSRAADRECRRPEIDTKSTDSWQRVVLREIVLRQQVTGSLRHFVDRNQSRRRAGTSPTRICGQQHREEQKSAVIQTQAPQFRNRFRATMLRKKFARAEIVRNRRINSAKS